MQCSQYGIKLLTGFSAIRESPMEYLQGNSRLPPTPTIAKLCQINPELLCPSGHNHNRINIDLYILFLALLFFFSVVGGTGGQIPAKPSTDSYTTKTGMRASTWQTLTHKMCHHFHNFACNLE